MGSSFSSISKTRKIRSNENHFAKINRRFIEIKNKLWFKKFLNVWINQQALHKEWPIFSQSFDEVFKDPITNK